MDDDDRKIIRLNKLRYTRKEIVDLLGTSKSTFHRELSLFRAIMHRKGARWTVWEVKKLLETLEPHLMIVIE